MQSNSIAKIKELITTYDSVVKVVDQKATEDDERAYGGVVRSVKGKLQEHLTEEIIKIAWEGIGGRANRLSIDSKKHKIPINRDYITSVEDEEVRQTIRSHLVDYHFGLSVDKQVCIDHLFVMGIECKAYTENAMIKRILVDFTLLKKVFPHISCYLFRKRSQGISNTTY